MKVVVCVVLAGIFVNTVKAMKSKQVNLALETVLRFDKNDRTADLEVIDKVQNFLEQIKDAMRQGNARRNTRKGVTFTDFILEAARILKEFDDIALEDAYVITNEESRRYINKESEFQDLFDNNDMRRFVSDQLDETKEMSAFLLRRNLDSAIDFIESQNKTGDKNNLLDIVNTLYDGASNKFMVALRNLDKVRRSASEIDLGRVLRNTLKSLVFDHYSNLDNHVREELINMVKHYWRAFSDNDKHAESRLKMVNIHEGKRHKHRANSPAERTHSKSRINKDKSYKSDERVNKNTHEKHEVFVSNRELKKLIKNKEEDKPVNIANDKPYKNSEPKNVHNRQSLGRVKSSPQLHRGKGNKHDRTEDRESIQESELSASSEPEVLMGGQIIRDTNFRADSSSRQVSESSDAEKDSSTEEIVIQHSNIVDVGLSRKSPGRINMTFVSSETHKTEGENSNESISIENKVMRKSNVNDTLETNANLLNVNLLIKKLEREIENVKGQVEHVKNLALTGIKKSNELPLTESTKNLTVAGVPSKDNGFSFRALDDSDDNSYSEIEIDSKKKVSTTSAATTDRTDANTVNGSKISNVRENTSESINVINNTNTDKSKEREIGDTHTYDTKKATDLKGITDIHSDPKISENGGDKHKDQEQENAIITENNFNSTATTLKDVKIGVQFEPI